MQVYKFFILAVAFALTACQSNQMSNMGSQNVSKLDLYQQLPMTEQNLLGTWQLQENTMIGSDNQPLTLQFNKGQVSVINGCNHITASYQINNNLLIIGSPISTRMACETPLMQLDNLAVNLFKGQIILEKFVDSLPENANMKILVNDKHYRLVKLK